MIVAPQPEAAEAGAAILRAGGTAIDAIIACALTQGVVDPMMCGLGGFGVLQLHDPRTGQQIVLDGLSVSPAACTESMWADHFAGECPDGFGYIIRDHANELGHNAVTVPGILRTLAAAHSRFGRLAWPALFEPAIAAAEEGWLVRPHVASMFHLDEAPYGRLRYRTKLAFTEDGRRLYIGADGAPKRLGAHIRNPELASTLRLVARETAETLYTGELARRIIADMHHHHGLLSAADLANYRPEQREPLRIDYRGYTIATPPPPAGGIIIAEILRILERFDLTATPHNESDYITIVSEAMKIAGRDKERYIGDPLFAPAPLDRLLSDDYADACAAAIRRGERASLPRTKSDAKDTTTISCIDAERHGGIAHPHARRALRRHRPGHRFHVERRHEHLRSPPGPSRLHRARKAPLLHHGADHRSERRRARHHPRRPRRRLDRRRHRPGADQHPRLGHDHPGSHRRPALLRHLRCDRHLQPHFPRRPARSRSKGYEVRRSPVSYAFAGVHGITRWDGALEGAADPQRDGLAVGIVTSDRH